jgi:hypothetical protein
MLTQIQIKELKTLSYPSKNFYPLEVGTKESSWMRIIQEAAKGNDYQYINAINKAGSIVMGDNYRNIYTRAIDRGIKWSDWKELELLNDKHKTPICITRRLQNCFGRQTR